MHLSSRFGTLAGVNVCSMQFKREVNKYYLIICTFAHRLRFKIEHAHTRWTGAMKKKPFSSRNAKKRCVDRCQKTIACANIDLFQLAINCVSLFYFSNRCNR